MWRLTDVCFFNAVWGCVRVRAQIVVCYKVIGSFVCCSHIYVFVWMVMSRWLLGCPDIALVCLLFCSVPDTIAFYSIGRHHWASYVASYAHCLIPVLWNFDKIETILE